MSAAVVTAWTQGIADDGTLQTFTPKPSRFHDVFYNMVTNSENWGIEESLEKVAEIFPHRILGKIVMGHKFTYYQVIE